MGDPERPTRSVVALLITTFCHASAAMAVVTVLGKQVYDMTGRELDLGFLGLAEFAPAALLVLVTGAAADRLDRRRVAAAALVGEAVAAGALALYASTKPTAPGPIFALVFLFGVARAFTAPATRALPADVVPPHRLPWLIPRQSASWQAAVVAGPVLGGFLYAVDVRLPYVAVVALLVTGAGTVLTVRVRPRPPTEPAPVVASLEQATMEAGVEPAAGHAAAAPVARAGWHEAVEGLRFIRRHPILLGAISLDLFAVLFGGAVALLPAIATDRLHTDSVGLGWLRAAGGLGAAAVTVWLALRPVSRRVGPTLLTAVATFGVFTLLLGVTRSFAVAFLAMAVLSGADAISVFIRATLVPLVTPAEKRGRVLAVENVFIGASNELGAFESGVAGQALGTTGAVVLGGVATLAIAAGWAVFFPDLRRVDEFPVAD